MSVDLPEIPKDGPRPRNYLRSQSTHLGVAGLVSRMPEPRVVAKPLPSGVSAEDPIVIEEEQQVLHRSNSQLGPRKRVRKERSSSNTSFASLVYILRNDRSVTSLLQAMLVHLKPPGAEEREEGGLRKRLDDTGREIPEEEWRVLRTQELVRQLSAALKRGLEKAGAPSDGKAIADFQNVIQQWIYNKLHAFLTNAQTPSTTPAPSTPTSLPSPFGAFDSTTPEFTDASEMPWNSDLALNELGIVVPPSDGSLSEQQAFDFGALEALLGLDQFSNAKSTNSAHLGEPLSSQATLSTLVHLGAPLAVGTAAAAIGPSSLGQLPSLPMLPYAIGQQTSQHHPISTAVDPQRSTESPMLGLSDKAVSSQDMPTIVPDSAMILPLHSPPNYAASSSLPIWAQPNAASSSSAPLAPSAASTTSNVPETPLPAVEQDVTADTANISLPNAVPRKTSKMETTLARARAHRETLQQALDKALGTMWELEIEHATLSKVVKTLTEQESLPLRKTSQRKGKD